MPLFIRNDYNMATGRPGRYCPFFCGLKVRYFTFKLRARSFVTLVTIHDILLFKIGLGCRIRTYVIPGPKPGAIARLGESELFGAPGRNRTSTP
jgi:hypothetical protein